MSTPTLLPGMTGETAASGGAPGGPPTVFYFSDYGLADEFVGVVHAVLHRVAPGVTVVDLTHGVPAFDVRAGSATLVRSVGHLGPGVVLGVVDPGVGTDRRGVALRSGDGRWFVGPDNGLFIDAAESCGGIASAWTLRKPPDAPATFDGRDVFAPAAAALAAGADPATVADPLDPAALVRLAPPRVEVLGSQDGRQGLRAEVTWVDRFGNVQLAAAGESGPPESASDVAVSLAPAGGVLELRRVRTFSELDRGELGVLVDANGHVALAVREGSAARATGASPGDLVELVW